MEVRRICDRKEAVLTEIHGDMQPLLSPELPRFMESLAANKVRCRSAFCRRNFKPKNLLLASYPPQSVATWHKIYKGKSWLFETQVSCDTMQASH